MAKLTQEKKKGYRVLDHSSAWDKWITVELFPEISVKKSSVLNHQKRQRLRSACGSIQCHVDALRLVSYEVMEKGKATFVLKIAFVKHISALSAFSCLCFSLNWSELWWTIFKWPLHGRSIRQVLSYLCRFWRCYANISSTAFCKVNEVDESCPWTLKRC